MQSLYLNIKDGIGIQGHAFCFLHISSQILFAIHLNFCKAVKHVLIILIIKEFLQFVGIFFEAVTDGLCKKSCKFSVTGEKPSSEGDSVSLIIEFLRIKLIESV